MSYLARTLIDRSWYLSGIVARGLETVNGDQITEGLFLLNALLEFKGSDLALIPYWTRGEVTLEQGTERYFLENVYDLETFTFNIGPVRFPSNNIPRGQYFGNGRVDNIESLPFSWHLERTKGGSYLYVYFLPNQNYVAQYTAKIALTDVSLDTDLSLVYDGFYIEYLRYALAEYQCLEYDIEFAPQKKAMLMTMEKKLSMLSPPDMTLKKIQMLNTDVALNWAYINLGLGFTP